MRTRNVTTDRPLRRQLGDVSARGSLSAILVSDDAGNEVNGAAEIQFVGATVTGLDGDQATVTVGGTPAAEDVSYDNSTSGLSATDVQEAIDEIAAAGGGNTITIAIPIHIIGGGSAITTGVKGEIEIPFACTLTGWTLIADQSGSVVIDIWKNTLANYPPTVADTITASDKPTLSSAASAQDLAPTGWATSVSAGDIIRWNVDSVATVTRVTLVLRATRTL
jgi:hypothetical protein